jgi:hypothetical protein
MYKRLQVVICKIVPKKSSGKLNYKPYENEKKTSLFIQ